MTEQEKLRCPNERPLYLYIQGHTRHNVDCMYCVYNSFSLNLLKIEIYHYIKYFI